MTFHEKEAIIKVMEMFGLRNLLFVLVMMALAGAAGFFVDRSLIKSQYIPNNPIFKNIVGTVEGKVTKIEGSVATVSDSQNRTAQFAVDTQINVSRRDPNSTNLITVTGTSAVDLNQTGFISVDYKTGQFTISHIIYP